MDSPVKFLGGYRALDLTDLTGQFCGRVLADLGMEVIKIEPPAGDPVRRLPPFIDLPGGKRLSATFAHLNSGKTSKVLDLETEEGRAGVRDLAKSADVVIESFAPGKMAQMGLGYRDLAAINPRVVMASITAFGQDGPKSKLLWSDIVTLAMSGFLYISGDPALPPCRAPETQGYYFGSLFAVTGILAALYRRARTGRGDHIDLSIQEALATQEHIIRLYANDGQIVKRQGSQHGQVAPAKMFPCRDGYVYLYVTRQHWKLFLDAWKEHPAEMDGPEWQNNLYRRAHADEINAAVEKFTRQYTRDELTALLQDRGIPCVPLNTPLGFTRDEHVATREFLLPVDHPDAGTVDQPAAPFMIDGLRPAVRGIPVLDEWRETESSTARDADSGRSEHAAASDAPLSGMRIVSFDHVLAGPYGTTVLAELGADVIKVESRRGGMDPFRFFGTGEDPNISPRFLEFNRNKRSLTINLKTPDGPRVLLDLVARSDAVLDNYSVDVMTRLGLAYEDLCRARPDIINLRMPGLGCTGPKRTFSTVGVNITAFTGFTYLWNHPGVTDPPIGAQTVFPDYVSGLLCAIIVISGVLYRDRQKKGAFIDLAQSEATAFMIGASMTEAVARGHDAEPMGNASPVAAPHGCYACRGEDRWCVISVETDAQWMALAKIIGGGIEADERFRTAESRLKNQEELNKIVEQWTRSRDRYDVMKELQAHGIPAGVVQDGADLTADEHLNQRGFIVAVENERLGRVVLPGFPMRFAEATLTRKWEFPVLGRDSDAVLKEVIGYSDEVIAAHHKNGVLE